MAVSDLRTFIVLFVFVLCSTCVRTSKLNVPRVLLPIFNDFPVNFTLEATEGGCYKWTTTRNDIISLTQINEDSELKCSTKVIVSTVTKEAARNIAVVLAEDHNTKQTLRCDVIVDVIHELSITTTTRELFMEEAPEDFEVKALDDQGNEFSTLEGIEFDWNIVSLGPKKDAVLRYITFRDSPYETPHAIEALESQGKKGYAILLEGIKSGSAKVTVRLPHPEYKHVAANEVQLMVVANLLISPAEVYIMPGDTVPFKIFFLNGGRIEEIKLPDAQYYLEAEDPSVAFSIKKSGNITGLKQGNTRIVLRDKNVGKDDPLMKLPAANLHVVQPNYVVINVLPHKNWAILLGDHHDIAVEVYCETDHKLYIGGSVQVSMDVTPEFRVTSRSSNGSWLTGYGIKPAIASVKAVLDSVFSTQTGKIKFDKPIEATSDLLIYPRITVIPSEVILPWDPITRPKYEIDLQARGGDSKFMWISSNNSIGLVSQAGHVQTLSNGFFEVSAVMLRNHHNRQSAKFIIVPPSRMEIVEFVMETEVGSQVYLHIALYAEHEKDGTTIQLPFTQCQELPFHIKQSDAKFRQNKTSVLPPIGVSCANIAMTALEVGTTKVTVSYYVDGKELEDSATVSAYNQLVQVQPKREIVLAVGTTINVVYSGGPRPLLGRASDHSKVVVSEDEKIATAIEVTSTYTMPAEDYTVVRVLCKKLGETDIKLMISNTPAVSNCKAQTSTVTTRVACGKPRRVTIRPQLQIANPSACPMDLSSGSAAVQSNDDVDLEVNVFDDCGQRFLNVSSLLFDWQIPGPKAKKESLVAKLKNKDGVFPRNLTVGDVPIGETFYQTVTPLVAIGTVTLNVTVVGYRTAVIKKYGIKTEWPVFMDDEDKDKDLPPITTSLNLYLVSNSVIVPNHMNIFNHPGNKRTASVKQGSGYFELALSADDIAMVKYLDTSREIEVIPLKSGELTLQLVDLCLVSKPAVLTINIVSVGMIRVEMVDKVEIGKCIKAIVRIYDENDNLLDGTVPAMIDLRPEFENKIANIQQDDNKKQWGPGEVHYIITGVEVGNTKLIFSVPGADEDVNSAPMDLQVFLPMRLSPRNGTMLIGSELQLSINGGPYPDANVEFKALNPKVIEISERGVIKGKAFGLSRIFARSIGIHPTTGQNVIYSEDTVEITVVQLRSLQILSPLHRFIVGATVPFWIWGVPDISPLVLGSVTDPPIEFRWTVDDKLMVDLSGIFHPVGVFKRKPDRVAIKVQALQPGRTRLICNATVPGFVVNIQNVETVVLSAVLEIEIIQELMLTNPKDVKGTKLLMAPFSEIQLMTNLDTSSSKITFTLLDTIHPSTELLADKSTTSDVIVTLSSNGIMKSFGTMGHTMLLVIAQDELGLKQMLAVAVEVKQIHYMNLIVVADWRIHSDSLTRTLPLGTAFQLRATFHDNMGHRFNAGPKELKIRTSRCDLIKVTESHEEASAWIYTKKEGHTMIKAWAEGIQQTADYVKLNVEQAVRPILDHLTSGDVVCLWTPVVTSNNIPGTWRSSDNSLITINPALDIAFVGNKEGVVILTHSLLQSAPIRIPIFPVQEIEFLDDPTMVLTNGEKYSVERVVLVLQSERSVGIKTNNLIQGWRCRTDVRKLVRPSGFRCFAEFSNKSLPVTLDAIFNISSSWVPETGQYACKLTNLGVNGTDISVLKTNVTLWATTSDFDTVSKRLTIKFLPGVYTDLEVQLSETTFLGEINVVGLRTVLEQISVYPADSSILYVDKGKEIDETTMRFQVQLIDYHWRLADMEDAMGVIVSSPITKQHIRVLVKVTGNIQKQVCGVGRSPLYVFLQNYRYAIATAVTMMIIFFMTFYFYSTYMQPVVNVNVQRRGMLSGRTSGDNVGRPGGGPGQSPPPGPGGSPTPHQCAANYAASFLRGSPSPRHGYDCGCGSPGAPSRGCAANASREPIYGDASSFYSSPEVRRNRRGM
ncbi:unnamed protein product [Callosobruchus maculatus]|uniref:WRKY domain-containing protein n=2 Tax=Callosobruchus maculatus TaxID=64391 RepID=A0A653D839_CALMS|nr:unnamed protein product [Callosobruchus maculatus]